MAVATDDTEIWAAIESISARVAKLEGSYVHLATKADIAEVKTLIVQQSEGNPETKNAQTDGRPDTKVESSSVDFKRLILKVTGVIIASQIITYSLLFTAIKLWG